MQVQTIQSTNFESKQRFITPDMHENIKLLLNKMNESSTYNSNGYYFRANIFKEISTKNHKVKFRDGRMFLENKINQKEIDGETLFTIGRTELVISNKTGEIIDYYKPLFSTWKNIIKNIGKYLEFFKNNFDNMELVEHKSLPIQGLTEKGLKKFRQLTEGVNG